MNYPKSPHPVPDPLQRFRRWATTALTAVLMAAQVTPAFATIDNTATATGTPPTGPNVNGTSNTVNVPVAPAAASMSVAKSAAAPVDVNSDGVIKAGDTITFTYTVTNTGNTTMYNVVPNDVGPEFGPANAAGTGTLGAYAPVSATIAPGGSQIYTAVYTLSDVDAFRAAGQTPAADSVSNTSKATGNIGAPAGPAINQANVTAGTASVLLPANPRVTVTKSYSLTKTPPNANAGNAEVLDIINYTYTVVNAGNVTLTGVTVDDTHEGTLLGAGTVANETLGTDGPVGTSTDATANNGVWSSMVAGATVTFTYAHTVNQTEFDNQ